MKPSDKVFAQEEPQMDFATEQAMRELDANVAEKVMGWRNCQPRASFDLPVSGVGFGTGDPPEGWIGHATTFSRKFVIPPFSTDDGAGCLVLEELRRRFGYVSIEGRGQGGFPDIWTCSAGKHGILASGPTFALAACRAGLKAVELKEGLCH